MKSLISVIIPVYNHAFVLRRCLHGLKKQSYSPLEIIIVNDGSKDNFDEVWEKLKKEEWFSQMNVKLLKQENKGAPAARNLGLRESNGEYIIFWDADTAADPKMLEKMEKKLSENYKASFVYSKFRFGWKVIKSGPYNFEKLKENNFIDTTSLIRKKDAEIFDEDLKRFQDWDLWLTMGEKGHVGDFIPEILFRKITGNRLGISKWIPSFVYKLPIKIETVEKYKAAREIIMKKHRLVPQKEL